MGTDIGTVFLLLLTQVVILQTPDVQNVFAGTALAAPLRNVVEANKINRQSQGAIMAVCCRKFLHFQEPSL